jgi:hypothetical protein
MEVFSAEQGHVLSDLKHDLAAEEREETIESLDRQPPPPTPDELRAVRWRIDRQLIPIMVGTYAIQFYGASREYL